MKCAKCGGTFACDQCGNIPEDIHIVSERVIPGSHVIISYEAHAHSWYVGIYWGWFHRRIFRSIWIETAVQDMRDWLLASEEAGHLLSKGEKKCN